MIESYFNAERMHGLMFIVVGLLAAGMAAWGWRHGAFWRGAAWPLVLVALLQLGVGATVWWRSPQDIGRVQHIVAQERPRLATEEIPRMEAVVKGFGTNRRVEIALIAAGLLLLMLAARGGIWQGVGAGLAAQAGLVLFLDTFAERRAGAYLAWLQSLP